MIVRKSIPLTKIIAELILPKFVFLPSPAPTDPLPQPTLVGEGIIHYEGGVEVDVVVSYLLVLHCAGAVVAVDTLAECAGEVVGSDRLRCRRGLISCLNRLGHGWASLLRR